ncbi:MAG TPA: TetR/AcrR family transcriptional regulator [Pseudonocardia sp.]|jgi:AcrR family transcriptional regulator
MASLDEHMPLDDEATAVACEANAPAARKARKQGQARRDELRAMVIEAVERRLRAGVSFAELNVADVAKECGISRSTFYAYFVDKTNLLGTWYEEFNHGLLTVARQWWALDASVTRPELARVLADILEAYRPHPELLAATHEAIGLDASVREAVEVAMQQYIDGLRAHIESGQRDGFVDPTLPPGETAYWLQWMAERGLHMLGRRGPDVGSGQMMDAYTGIVWNALYAPVRNRTIH